MEFITKYPTATQLLKRKVFKQEFDLVAIAVERQQERDRAHGDLIADYNIITVLLRSDDGRYYKVSAQNDYHCFNRYKNSKGFTVKEVDTFDIREIGSWQMMAPYNSKKLWAQYKYFIPKKHLNTRVIITKHENTLKIGDIAKIQMEKNGVHLLPSKHLTDRIGRKKMITQDIINMAEERKLKPQKIGNFIL